MVAAGLDAALRAPAASIMARPMRSLTEASGIEELQLGQDLGLAAVLLPAGG